MTGLNSRWARLTLLGALCLPIPAAWALDPGAPPGTNFDLAYWKIQLPTSNGVLTAASGTTDSTNGIYLAAGFTNAYFYTGSDGAMVFWAPDNGARTGGSAHPRSELREQIIPGNDDTNWTVYGTHIMTAQCQVLQVPSDTKKVCIGQMHEPNTKPDGSPSAGNEHMIMFDLKNLKIYVNINLDGNLSSSFSQTVISGSGVALSNTINYTMSAVNGLLTIIVNNATNSWNLFSGTNINGHIAQNWDTASSNTLYFKAGSYNQTTNLCNCATDGATVAFYALSRYHAPSITNQPASQTVAVGSNVTFKVGALGNSPLKYAWLLNGTPINLATNASLTLPNVQLASAGSYSVVVTDLVGSVTSSVATLTVLSFGITAIAREGDNIRIAWAVGAGSTNALQSASGTATGNYSNNFSDIFTVTNAVGTITNYLDVGAATNKPARFYRVRLVPSS